MQAGHSVERSLSAPSPLVFIKSYVETRAGLAANQYSLTEFPGVVAAERTWTIESIQPSFGWFRFTYDGETIQEYLAAGWTNRFGTRADYTVELFSWGNVMGGTPAAGSRTGFARCRVGYSGAQMIDAVFDPNTAINDRPLEWHNDVIDPSTFEVWDAVP
jgi:hypothetical protein